jgi:predicted ATPase
LTAWLHRHTDGNPLFLVTTWQALVEQGVLQEEGGRWALQGELEAIAVGVPESLRATIEQQMARLAPEAQRVLEAASVAGMEFSAAAVAAGLEAGTGEVEEHCEALTRHQILRSTGVSAWPDGTLAGRYAFGHALYQQVIYQQLRGARRIRMHLHIGLEMEKAYGSRAGEIAAELAEHFIRGREPHRAVQYLRQASETAARRYAHREVIVTATRALELIETLPDTPERAQQELALHATLGPAFVVTKGFGALEVERTYTRARELCRQVGDPSQRFSVLWGVWRLYAARAVFQTAQQLGEELLSLAQRPRDPAHLLMAHFALGGTYLFQGHALQAYEHAKQGTGLYDAPRHRPLAFRYGEDPGVACRSYEAFALGLLGYPDQALTRMRAMLAWAQELAHPFSQVRALGWLTRLYLLRREPQAVLEQAENTVSLATEQGFSQWAAQGVIMRGWALATLGRGEEGLDQIHRGLADYRATGSALRPEVLALLAETYGHSGRGDAGLRLLHEALDWADRTGGRWWNAELHRLTGELLRQHAVPDVPQAEAHVQQALEIARQQQAKSWELRSAMSLSRLWQQQGRSEEARQLLSEAYGWFTEGFETADLQEAKILLETLQG